MAQCHTSVSRIDPEKCNRVPTTRNGVVDDKLHNISYLCLKPLCCGYSGNVKLHCPVNVAECLP
jgi:hypothetical protein